MTGKIIDVVMDEKNKIMLVYENGELIKSVNYDQIEIFENYKFKKQLIEKIE